MNPIAIIDNGSGECKAGLTSIGSNGLPQVKLLSAIGRPKQKQAMLSASYSDYYFGSELTSKKGILNITYPIEHGVITNFQDMQLLWKHLFENELKVDPSTLSVLLTEAPYNPKVNREHMVEYMFEGFSVQKAYIAIQAVLSIYATGRTTGLITDIGDGVTHTVPIYEGFSIQHAVNRFNLAGRDITDYLSKLLYEIGIETSSSSMKEIVKDIKEKMSYISSDFESDIESAKSTPGEFTKQYQLPDGQIISMTDQLFRCAELLFRPSLNGFDMPGLHRILNKSIQEADIDLRKSMYENIILSGGTTTIPGIAERLEKEMYFIAPSAIQTKIVALPQRKYLVYSGGVALASLECFQDQWITKNDYLEYGSNIVHIKCI